MLVTVVLLLFLGNLRAALIVALIIPLSLLATFIGLTLRGIPANLLSLGAMDFGIIVDGAVIVVENIVPAPGGREREELRDAEDAAGAPCSDATVEVGRPTLFSMLIIIVAHIPIFTLQRHEGRIFAPMAYTVTSALIGSLIFSLTLVPLLCFCLLRHEPARGEPARARGCQRVYEPVLALGARAPAALVIGSRSCALAGSLALAHAARQRVPARAERRHDLGQRARCRRGLGQRGAGA